MIVYACIYVVYVLCIVSLKGLRKILDFSVYNVK